MTFRDNAGTPIAGNSFRVSVAPRTITRTIRVRWCFVADTPTFRDKLSADREARYDKLMATIETALEAKRDERMGRHDP
jgi:hypothetical protein